MPQVIEEESDEVPPEQEETPKVAPSEESPEREPLIKPSDKESSNKGRIKGRTTKSDVGIKGVREILARETIVWMKVFPALAQTNGDEWSRSEAHREAVKESSGSSA